jgi:hypothetical protein
MDPKADKLWTGPCRPWEHPGAFKEVRFLMALDIAKVKFDYAMTRLVPFAEV